MIKKLRLWLLTKLAHGEPFLINTMIEGEINITRVNLLNTSMVLCDKSDVSYCVFNGTHPSVDYAVRYSIQEMNI